MSLDLLKDYQTPGTPPGTLRPAEGEVGPTRVFLTSYSAEALEAREVTNLEDLRALSRKGPAHWIHVTGLADVAIIGTLGEIFGLHPLALEDVVHLGQRPKAEDYDDVLFATTQHLAVENGVLIRRQVSLFLGNHFVLTFQQGGPDLLQSIGSRLARAPGRMRQRGPSYLAYAILDVIVDAAFPALESMGDRLDDLEEQIVGNPNRNSVADLLAARRELLRMRQVLWPQREVLSKLAREEHRLIRDDTRIFLRDCYDHAVQALEVAENYREMAAGLLDVYHSSLSNRLNDVMKVLTMISTVFIPLGFLAGVYGMNFETERTWNMPELAWRFGYLGFWGVVVLVAGGMVLYFKRKGWM